MVDANGPIVVTFAGTGSVGKTCLIKRSVNGCFDPYEQPTTFDEYEKEFTKTIAGEVISVNIKANDLGG